MTTRDPTPAEALRWIDTQPHWIGAASPEIDPVALVLTGYESIRIPSETLRDMEGLYTTGTMFGRHVAKSKHRMFEVTALGFTYLILLDRGVVFDKIEESAADHPGAWQLTTPGRSYPGVVGSLKTLTTWAVRYGKLPDLTEADFERDRATYATATPGYRAALARKWGGRAIHLV